MPIVFVHGVNNRKDDEYRDNEVGRNAFLRQIVGPALGIAPQALQLSCPYWGDDAAKFAWNMKVLPDASVNYEAFGADGDVEAFGRTVDIVAEAGMRGGVVEHARRNFPETVDLLYGATLAGATTAEQSEAIASSYLRASAYADAQPNPAWLNAVTDANFVDVLNYRVEQAEGEYLGSGVLLDTLKEGLSRLIQAIPAAVTDEIGRLGRKMLNATVTRFAGDAFVYLAKRGAPEDPGPIVKIVLCALREAETNKKANDEKLIVIAHSFGGEIVYDILTQFATDLQVDCLITVGSQVGLFEEMKLYLASKDSIPPDPPAGKVPRPTNLKRWLNVFDTNDVLSYRAAPIFDGADDYLYDTGFSSFQAHGGYFLRPSFYKRLAARLTK